MRGRYDSQVTLLAFIDLERECQRIIPCVLSRGWRTKP